LVEATPAVTSTGDGTAAALALATSGGSAAVPRGQPLVRKGQAGLAQTTSAILADLEIVREEGDTGSDMLEMSSTTMAGLRGALGQDAGAVVTLETMVAGALREGKPDAVIDEMVNTAVLLGAFSVPAELVTSDGRVDTAVLLASLVTQAQIASGQAVQIAPEDVIVGGAGVEVHLVTSADGTAESAQFYTMGAGDSLGAIALKFYGNGALYPRIFEANRAIMSSPDRLTVGQRLVIPSGVDL